MTVAPSILDSARRVRRWAKRLAREQGACPDLTNRCAIVSARLLQDLQAHGHAACVVVWNGSLVRHCHVEVDGAYLVDVTCTQFGRRPIEIHPLDPRPRARYWQGRRRFDSVEALRVHLVRTGWSSEAIPTA